MNFQSKKISLEGHSSRSLTYLASVILISTLLISICPFAYGQAPTMVELSPPTANSAPYGLAIDSSGKIWFTEIAGNKIGKLTPPSTFQEFTVPTAGAYPYGMVIDSSGNIWFAEFQANRIGKLDPSTGVITEYSVTSGSGPREVAIDPSSGNIWFTEFNSHKVGLMSSAGVLLNEFPTTGLSYPTGIAVDASGNAWFCEQMTHKIGKLTPAGALSEYSIPTANAQPVFLDIDSAGSIWFTETQGNKIGKMTAAGTVIAEYTIPTANSKPLCITIDASGNIWFSEKDGNKIGKMTPAGSFTEYTIPTPNSVTYWLAVDASGNVWFAESDGDKIGRLSFPDFSIYSTPASLTVAQASSIASTITVRSVGAFSSSVALTTSWVGGSTPAGTTVEFNSTSLTPPPDGSKNATLTVTTTSSTATGSYTLRVTGTSGALSHYVDIAVTVSAGAFDFTVDASPTSRTANQGQSVTYGVTVSITSGIGQTVTLSIEGLPADTTYTFNPSSGTPAYASTLTVQTSSTTPTGTFTLTIKGSGGGITRSKTATLQVNPAATPTPTPTPTSTPTSTPPPGGCLVATATYGSELSPEVQFLRGFRDRQVLSTFAGSEFMKAFNAWYYSFSPSVASFIANNPTVRAAMKVLFYPLVGILHLSASAYGVFNFNPELAVCIAGLVASGLIGVVYFSPFALAVLAVLRRTRRLSLSMRNAVPLAYVWAASVGFLILSILTLSPVVMMASSALFVLTTIGLTSLSAALKILQRFP